MSQLSYKSTKILISGDGEKENFLNLLVHTTEFVSKPIDFQTDKYTVSAGHHFVVIEDSENQNPINPTILVLLRSENEEKTKQLLASVTPGGIVIFDEENPEISQLVAASSNYFRKIPFQTPPFEMQQQQLLLDTNLGIIPVNAKEWRPALFEAAKHLSQQLGIMEEEFYESLINF